MHTQQVEGESIRQRCLKQFNLQLSVAEALYTIYAHDTATYVIGWPMHNLYLSGSLDDPYPSSPTNAVQCSERHAFAALARGDIKNGNNERAEAVLLGKALVGYIDTLHDLIEGMSK